MQVQEDVPVGGATEQVRCPLDRHRTVAGRDHRQDDPGAIASPPAVGQVVGLGDRDLTPERVEKVHDTCLPVRSPRSFTHLEGRRSI